MTKPARMGTNGQCFGRLLVAALTVWLLAFSACAPGRLGGRTISIDRCFNGTYERTDVTRTLSVTVVHDEGAVSLSGFNSRPDTDVPWELISFTGSVASRGRASGSVTLWFPRSDGLPVTRDGTGTATLVLSNTAETDCAVRTDLTMSFSYADPSGISFSENPTLTRQ